MRLTPTLLAATALVACSDSFAPTTENVAGDYVLQALVTDDTSGTTDWKSAGATWTMTLTTNGITTGHLFIPGAGEGGSDVNADMAGTWTLSGDTVEFSQAADSFVRDMPFFARENRLTGDHTFGPTRVRLLLKP